MCCRFAVIPCAAGRSAARHSPMSGLRPSRSLYPGVRLRARLQREPRAAPPGSSASRSRAGAEAIRNSGGTDEARRRCNGLIIFAVLLAVLGLNAAGVHRPPALRHLRFTLVHQNFPLTVVITHGRFSIWGWTDDPEVNQTLARVLTQLGVRGARLGWQ